MSAKSVASTHPLQEEGAAFGCSLLLVVMMFVCKHLFYYRFVYRIVLQEATHARVRFIPNHKESPYFHCLEATVAEKVLANGRSGCRGMAPSRPLDCCRKDNSLRTNFFSRR